MALGLVANFDLSGFRKQTNKNKKTKKFITVSMETVRMAESRPINNKSKHSDSRLSCHKINI